MNKEVKDLKYWKNNCEEDYIKTPISVLRYITELENNLKEAINFTGSSETLNCTCKKPTFTRVVDVNYNLICGKCGGLV